jgi:DNA-binding response OmpR family regulator
MLDYDFSAVECVLYEPEGNVRRLLRGALNHLKLPKIQPFGHLDDVRACLQTGSHDLLIADAADPDSDIFKLITALRHNQLGGNPFLAVIVTTFRPTQLLLARTTNSGADTLLVKPVAPKQIRERITALIETPRRFVVTSDLVGPDRRKNPRENSQIPLIEVPNTLRLKALGMAVKTNVAADIDTALAEVNAQKLIRQSFQAMFLIEFAMPGLAAAPFDAMALDHLWRVPAVMEDLMRRLPSGGEGSSGPTVEQCRALRDAVAALKERMGAAPPPLAEFKAQALAIQRAIQPARPADLLEREVCAAVATYRARLEAMAQAKLAEADPGASNPQNAS